MTELQQAQKQCRDCRYRRDIPGDAHSQCVFPWGQSESDPPKGNRIGREGGWYMFPWNYDPVWQETICPEKVAK